VHYLRQQVDDATRQIIDYIIDKKQKKAKKPKSQKAK
jgi:hypothetical protein